MAKELRLSFLTQDCIKTKEKIPLLSTEKLTELVTTPLEKNEVTNISIATNVIDYDGEFLQLTFDQALDFTVALKKNNSLKFVSLEFEKDSFQTMGFVLQILEAFKNADLESFILNLPATKNSLNLAASNPLFLKKLLPKLAQIRTIKQLSIDAVCLSAFSLDLKPTSLEIFLINEDNQTLLDLENFIKNHPTLTELITIGEGAINPKTPLNIQINLAEAMQTITFKKIDLPSFYYKNILLREKNSDKIPLNKEEIQEKYNSFPLLILKHPTVEELYFNDCPLQPADLNAGMFKNSKLKILDLSQSLCGELANQCLINLGKAIEENSSLQSLDLSANHFSHKGLFAFLQSLLLSKARIKKLRLSNLYHLSGNDYELIANFTNSHSTLEEIKISGYVKNQPQATLCLQLLDYFAKVFRANRTLKILDLSEMCFSEINRDALISKIDNLAHAIELNPWHCLIKEVNLGEIDLDLKSKLQAAIQIAAKNREKFYQLRTASLHDNSSKNVNSKAEKSENFEDSEEPSEKISKTEMSPKL